MVSSENPNWVSDFDFITDIPVPGGHLPSLGPSGFHWPSHPSAPISVDYDDSYSFEETGSKKRARPGLSSASGSKACREKLRRDKLNDRFLELGSMLDPGRPPKMDKVAVLVDAIRMLKQLQDETQNLKDSNGDLQEKINGLKAEKNELRDEKQRLRAEKESLEQRVKALSLQPSFLPHPPTIPSPYSIASQVPGSKTVPLVRYPGVSMWQFMPPAAVDTSQDHVLRPPVA